jgi:hypothetical protein
MNMGTLSQQLAALATLSPVQLRAEWRRVYRTSPPRLTPDLLLRGIAYRLQERAHGSLPPSSARELQRIAKRLEAGAGLATRAEVRLKPGTRLVRSWNGTTYSVLVTDDGFLLGDAHFTSLSQIAETITGAHWSGPRFFGIKAAATTTGAAAASGTKRASAAAGGTQAHA